jgi:hypothetical protein
MTVAELEQRLLILEQAVEDLRARLPASANGQPQPGSVTPATQRHWWRDDAGAFADDPGFEEMVRLGREYRESLRPGARKKAKKSPTKARKGK